MHLPNQAGDAAGQDTVSDAPVGAAECLGFSVLSQLSLQRKKKMSENSEKQNPKKREVNLELINFLSNQ